jgi:hypothetical protein
MRCLIPTQEELGSQVARVRAQQRLPTAYPIASRGRTLVVTIPGRRIRVALLVIGAIVMLLAGCSDKRDTNSVWTNGMVVVDGKGTEWTEVLLDYSEEAGLPAQEGVATTLALIAFDDKNHESSLLRTGENGPIAAGGCVEGVCSYELSVPLAKTDALSYAGISRLEKREIWLSVTLASKPIRP